MLILKTLIASLFLGSAIAASTIAGLAPDHGQVMKSDLPIITSAMLHIGSNSNPYPSSYEADIALVADEENCDEAEPLDAVTQIADTKSDYGTKSVLH